MESGFQLVTPAEARAAIAAHLLPASTGSALGEIVLATHQVAAARRLLALLAAHGGALLADDVGLGKTYVSLAVARRYARALVIAPAGLRGMWRAAMLRAGVDAPVVSYESLSRGPPPVGLLPPRSMGTATAGTSIVILDEAHRARSSSSRRYPRIAGLASGAHTLLLTATPLPNRLDDLRALVALFAGSRAATMPERELAALVCRRTAASVPAITLPAVAEPQWIEIRDDSACLDALQRLPPAVPAADGGSAGALMLLGLVRQWASSRGALVATLRRSLAKSLALRDALEAGHMPTALELRTWYLDSDTMQLAFPELVSSSVQAPVNRGSLEAALREHSNAASALLVQLAQLPDPDAERARHVAALQATHPRQKIVCFTEFAETAAAYWRHLRMRPGVAWLSARGGQIASGRISREAVLQRFAPDGQQIAQSAAIEDISILVTTDLLSEGVDLRDATVVVHLDLPWSPARMEQRVGRARRMGSPADSIAVYAMRPPAPSERVLELERRLRHKVALAVRTVGSGATVLPRDAGSGHATPAGDTMPAEAPALSNAEARSSLIDMVAAWSQVGHTGRAAAGGPVAAIVTSSVEGWLAAISVGGESQLVASLGGMMSDDPGLLRRACALADCVTPADALHSAPGHDERLEAAAARAMRYAAERATAALLPTAGGSNEAVRGGHARGVRHHLLSRIHQALATAAPQDAPRIARLAAAARHAVNGRLSAGTEFTLRAMANATAGDDAAWLATVAELAEAPSGDVPAFQLRAIIVFAPTLPCRESTTRS